MPQRDLFLHIVPRKITKELGLKRYFTGSPCKRNHIRERSTANGTCLECQRISQLKPVAIRTKPKFDWRTHKWNKRGWCGIELNYDNLSEKSCSSCGELKLIGEFAKDKKNKSGYRSDCNTCKNNGTNKWKAKNKASLKESKLKWDIKNTKRRKEYRDSYLANDNVKSMRVASENKRRATKIKAIPSWFTGESVESIYQEARAANMQVDHIIPLTSAFVCGLHCRDNMQLLDPIENIKKGNRYWQDMPNTKDPELLKLVREFQNGLSGI